MENIDIALTETDGIFDISFENGDLKTINNFDTAIDMSVYCERRADETEQPVNYLRRGWWGNTLSEVEGYEIGSKLWQYYQSRLTQDTNNKVINVLQEALQWLVEDGHLQNIIVTSSISEGKIQPKITLVRSNNEVESRSYKLWNNTTGA